MKKTDLRSAGRVVRVYGMIFGVLGVILIIWALALYSQKSGGGYSMDSLYGVLAVVGLVNGGVGTGFFIMGEKFLDNSEKNYETSLIYLLIFSLLPYFAGIVLGFLFLPLQWHLYLAYRESRKGNSLSSSEVQKESREELEKSIEEDDKNFTDADVLNFQLKFEERIRIQRQAYVPASISSEKIYIYNNLMKEWYSIVYARHRYDKNIGQQLRNDWVEYLSSIMQSASANFMWNNANQDDKNSEEYERDFLRAEQAIIFIEDAIANQIGSEAINELARVRKMNFQKFNIEGEMAPEGMIYNYKDELVAEETKKNPTM